MNTTYQTCRFCKRRVDQVIGPLFKYAVRHYICALCFLNKGWGWDRLKQWQIEQFPALLAQEFGRYDELGNAIKTGRAKEGGAL